MRSTRYFAGALVGAASIAATSLLAIPASAAVAGPVAHDDSYSVAQDQTLSIGAPGVLGNDTDVNPNSLSVTSSSTTTAHGSVSLHSNGSFTYIPGQGYSGPDSFAYVISDAQALSSSATVFITVGPGVTPGPVGTTSGGSLNCTQLAARGIHDIPVGSTYYRRALDRDNDGIACETNGDDTRVGLPAPTPTPAPTVIYKYVGGKYCKCTNGGPCVPVPTPAPTPAPSTVVIAPPTQTLVAPPPVTAPSPVIIYPPAPSGSSFSQIGQAPAGAAATGFGPNA